LLTSKIIKLINNLICELIIVGFMRCVSSPNRGVQFAWAGDVKNSQIVIGHQNPPQFILQDRHLVSLILVFVYSKVGPNLKYYYDYYFSCQKFIYIFIFTKKDYMNIWTYFVYNYIRLYMFVYIYIHSYMKNFLSCLYK